LLEQRDEEWWPRCEYRWERGRIAFLRLDKLWVEFARLLAPCIPELRLLRELHIDRTRYAENDEFELGPDVPPEWGQDDQSASLYVLSQAEWISSLRAVRVGPWTDESYEYAPGSIHVPGQAAHLIVEKAPWLEEIYLMAYHVDTKTIFTRSLTKLRVLQIYHAEDYPLRELADNGSLTNLTHLLCHPKA